MIRIANASMHVVLLSVNGEDAGKLLSAQTKAFNISGVQADITLKPEYTSYAKGDNAHLSVESTYSVDLTEDVTLTVTREKILFEWHGYYDALLVQEKDAIIASSYQVSDKEKVRKKLKSNHLLDLLLIDPVADMLLEPIVDFGCFGTVLFYLAVMVGATYFRVWKYVLMALAAFGLINVLASLACDKSIKCLFKKLDCETATALSELDRWTDPEFISQYYSQPERRPVTGKIQN